ADDEEMAIVLAVPSPVLVNRVRRIGGTDGEVGEDPRLPCGENARVSLVEYVDVAVLALDIDVASAIDGGPVDAPLESVRMPAVVYTSNRPVGIPMAVPRLSALELPLRHQIGVDLGDEERPPWNSSPVADHVGKMVRAAALRDGRVVGVAVEAFLFVV